MVQTDGNIDVGGNLFKEGGIGGRKHHWFRTGLGMG
jgi:hypothetical protein